MKCARCKKPVGIGYWVRKINGFFSPTMMIPEDKGKVNPYHRKCADAEAKRRNS